MSERSLFSWPIVAIGSIGTALALMIGCSSDVPPSERCDEGEAVPCTCANGQSGTGTCGFQGCSCDEGDAAVATLDAGLDAPPVDTPGDATHLDDKSAPATTYGVCAAQGSFGWPCTVTTTGPDPAECTDPDFPDCFVGGQSSWCTASCAQFGVCPGEGQAAGDAGCVPVACNARGYCK